MKITFCKHPEETERALRPLLTLKDYDIALDIETRNITGGSALDPLTSIIRTIQVNWGPGPVVVDMLRMGLEDIPTMFQVLTEPTSRKVIHNGKFEYTMIKSNYGIELQRIWCTMLAEQVINNGKKNYGYGYADLVKRYFNHEVSKLTRQSDWNVPRLGRQQVLYCGKDVKWLLNIPALQFPQMDKYDRNIAELEMDLIQVFGDMELTGIKIDSSKVKEVKERYKREIDEKLFNLQQALPWVPLPASTMKKKAMQEKYPNGTRPVGEGMKSAINDFKAALLLLDIKLPTLYDKVKKKYRESLSSDTYDLIKTEIEIEGILQPIGPYMKQYTERNSLYGKYLSQMEKWVHPKTRRVHYSVSQIKVTGRISKSDPPLQQMPRESWFRALFIARNKHRGISRQARVLSNNAKYYLLKLDYSQLELRICADVFTERNMMREYKKGMDADLHTLTATEVYGKAWDEVTKDERYTCKAVNFGTIYGQGHIGLQQYLVGWGIIKTLDECKEFIQAWFRLYPNVLDKQKDIKAAVRCNFYIVGEGDNRITKAWDYDGAYSLRTSGGRQRHWMNKDLIANKRVGPNKFALHGNDNYVYVNGTEMYNFPIQGTAGDIMKFAMLAIYWKLRKYKIAARIVLNVHDELVLEVREDHLFKAAKLCAREMEYAGNSLMKNGVPIYVDVQYGDDWSAPHELRLIRKNNIVQQVVDNE